MKKVLSWLCLLIAFGVLPHTALAAYSPSKMYVLYSVNGGDWTGKQEMISDGDKSFSYTFPAVESGKNVLFMLASDYLSADKCVDGISVEDWEYLQGSAWVQYTFGPHTDYVQNEIAINQELKLQGKVKAVLKISQPGAHTITVTKNGKDSNTNEKLSFTYTTGGSGVGIPVYWGYHGDNAKWVHNSNPLRADADGVYSFTINNRMNHNQYFYLSDCNINTDRLDNGFPRYRFVDPDEEIDYSLAESGNPDFGRHESRSVLFVPGSKNHNVTVKFKYDAERGITDLTYEKVALPVITDERTKANLPLLPRHFFKDEAGTQPQSHYFIVGTRMADWRLQPEWEMTRISDTQYKITTPRVMYTGLLSVAKVSRYDNYANSRYYRFSANGADIRPNNSKVSLSANGKFAFYRDVFPNTTNSSKFYSDNTRLYNDGSVTNDPGVVVKEIILTVDPSTGDPTDIEFVYTSEPVTDYITLSLVGQNIINDGLPEADMTQAGLFAKDKSSSWQESWVQYNPTTGVPYRDAAGMLFYQTVFQSDWLDEHPTFFNKKIRDGHDFNYTSQSVIMRNAKSFDEAELAEDPYRDYYGRFNNGTGYLGNNGTADQNVVIGDNINYNEFLRYHNGGTSNGISYGNRTGGKWECFVVKDMWMDDFFKIWTGWGGGRKVNDCSGAEDPQSARWYYANGGHGHEGCHSGGDTQCSNADGNGTGAEVRGYDIMKKNNTVGVYGTARDKNQADFWIHNLTYFKRVIVWYDPVAGFDNSVVQFIIERCGSAIQAIRGTLGSQIEYIWNIPDPANPLTDEEKALPVTHYVIERYKLNEETDRFELNGTNAVEDVECQGKTIGDFMADQQATDSNLRAGTYRYRVIVTMVDAEGREVNREAWSNRVTLFDATVPVVGQARQITEESADGKTFYSFDMELDLDLANYLNTASFEGHGINDLAEGYYVTIDPKVMDDFNNATAATYICTAHDNSEVRTIDKFVQKEGGLEQMVNGQLVTTDRAYIFIPFEQNHIGRRLVWENIVKSHPDEDYNFQLFLKRNPKWETIFAAANFGMNTVDAPFVVPGVELEFKSAQVVVDNGGDGEDAAHEIFAGKRTPEAAMPMGSHNGSKLVAPVHYSQANRLDAIFTLEEPAVTQKVKDNFTIAYAASDADMAREALPAVDAGGLKAVAVQEGLDVTAIARKLDYEADGKEYMTVDADAKLPVYALADVTYTLGSRSMKPAEMTRATGNAAVELVRPNITVKAQALTNEQVATDNKRYYVHELQANITFNNVAESGMVVRPGFYLKGSEERAAQFDCEFGSTSAKEANGGVVAHANVKGGSDFYDCLLSYTPYNGTYDHATDNWSRFAADEGRLPVYVDYFSAAEKKAGDTDAAWQKIPNIDGYVVYHYPFIVKKDAAGTASMRAARADDENNIKVLTMNAVEGQLNVKPLVLTAIDGVEADTDWSDAEFFNLQGIRVAQPEPGQVYMVRRGTEVTKELYR